MPLSPNQILRFFIQLVLGILAAVFGVSMLAAGLIALVLSFIRWLVTGKKPALAIAFSRFRQFSPQNSWSGRVSPKKPAVTDVVDVEVREVHEARNDKRLP